MKKTIVLMAAIVAAGVTFTGCSNEEELTQVIEQPAVKGTQFSVNPYADGTTRATLYNADAWGTTGTTGVTMFKLWGKQAGADAAWMKNAIFTRSYDANNDPAWSNWAPVRTDDGSVTSLAWPTDDNSTDTDERTIATTFYAITGGTASDVTGVSQWMSTEGKFKYGMTTAETAIPHIDVVEGTAYLTEGGVNTYVVDASTMSDLMVATETKKESETTNGVLPLSFSHTLAGLSIKLIFRNDVASTNDPALIHYIKVYGLKTSGTYTFGSGWGSLADEACYYKAFNTPVSIQAQVEATEATAANYKMLVDAGEWLVIPQTTTPWDGSVKSSGEYIADGDAYIVLGITDDQETENVEVFLPLNTTFTAGKNKTLRIDLGSFRDLYLDAVVNATNVGTTDGLADYYFAPALGGGGAPAFIFEEE